MKPFLILLSIIFCIKCSTAQTYQYHPLVDSTSTKEWDCYCYAQYHAMGGGIVWERPGTLMTGDTLINGLTYRKLFQSGSQYNYGTPGFVIEDSTHKVYMKPSGDTTSSVGVLIMDFMLQPNDTFIVPYYFSLDYDTTYVVKSVDTLFFSGALRKRITFFPPDNYLSSSYDTWVEGIGSLIYGIYLDSWCHFENTHLCSELENGNQVYTNLQCSYTAIHEIDAIQLPLNVYPNPASGLCTLDFGNNQDLLSATIFDLTGREILPLFTNQRINTFTFNTNALAPGIYLTKVISSEGTTALVKLVKQ